MQKPNLTSTQHYPAGEPLPFLGFGTQLLPSCPASAAHFADYERRFQAIVSGYFTRS
jgi:hypothetical protein